MNKTATVREETRESKLVENGRKEQRHVMVDLDRPE